MSLWIQVDTNRSSNRKTYLLAELLSQGAGDLFPGRDDVAWLAIAIAVLDEFWAWAAEHHPDGDVTAAHQASIRKPLLQWLHGTEWARKDARELLVKSGHIDRRADGRLLIHDWLEWTGGSVLRLAKERKRKRMARSKRPRTRARTVRAPSTIESADSPAYAVQGSAVQSSAVQSSPKQQQPPPAKLDYVTRCCVAVNRVLDQHLAGAFAPLVPNVERPTAQAWEAAGIPIDLAEQTLADLASRFPNGRARQPQSLGYFTAALHEAHAKTQAAGTAAPLKDYERMRQAAEEERRREEAAK